MADGTGHKIMTIAAVEALPQWMQLFLQSEKDNLGNEYCMYGDSYFIDPERIGPYIELPDGRLPMDPWEIRHFRKDGPGKDFYTCGYYDLMRYSFEYFAEKCIKAISNNDIATFAKFMGSIIHVIEDSGTPPHAVGTEMGTDMKLIKSLYPCDDKGKMVQQFHSVLESKFVPYALDYQPRLLGISAAEIAFNLFERFTDMLEYSISLIIPILDAYYANDDNLLAERISKGGKFASEVVADYLYSVITVGQQRFNEEEMASLNSCSISDSTPIERTAWAPAPYHYCEIRKSPWNLTSQFQKIPLSLSVDGEQQIFEKGFGIGAPFEITYILPDKVYNQFQAVVGINNKLGAETEIIFKVFGDDIELTQTLCKNIDESSILNVDISGIKKLTLKTEPKLADDSKIHFGMAHTVWGNAKLIKFTSLTKS